MHHEPRATRPVWLNKTKFLAQIFLLADYVIFGRVNFALSSQAENFSNLKSASKNECYHPVNIQISFRLFNFPLNV